MENLVQFRCGFPMVKDRDLDIQLGYLLFTIPTSVKEEDLDQFIEGRPQKKRALKDAIYSLVSRLTPPVYDKDKGNHLRDFKTLKSEDLNRMT